MVFAASLFPSFCCWEARQDPRHAMLPLAIMKELKFLVLKQPRRTKSRISHQPRRFSLSGIVIGSTVQAALYTAANNGLANWRGHQLGFCFLIGCLAIGMVLIMALLPKPNEIGSRAVDQAESGSTEKAENEANGLSS